MAHLAAILFFLGLLALLGAILEHLLTADWPAIERALRSPGRPPAAPLAARPRRCAAAS